jgi:AcrR family transcriptional regulator
MRAVRSTRTASSRTNLTRWSYHSTMPRRYDSAETRRLILTAATVEFARRGVDGARVDRIAETAGTSKGSIYAYFGSKDGLFAAVIGALLGDLREQVPIDPADLPGYAGHLFDYLCAHPDIVRLYVQEALAFSPADMPDFDRRHEWHEGRIALVDEGVSPGTDAAAVFFSVIAQAYWFVAVPQVVRMVFGDDEPDAVRARYRIQLVENTRRMILTLDEV